MNSCFLIQRAAAVLALFLAPSASPETVDIVCSADTTLHEFYPENNFGAFSFVNSGSTAKDTRNRALLRFDLAAHLPEGARITSASLKVTVSFAAPQAPPPELEFGLHRLLLGWGEGTKDASSGNSGKLATAGEATWRHAAKPAPWSAPGGAEGVDFVSGPAAVARISALGEYIFPSTPGLVGDLQLWADDPAANFGWMLKSADETLTQSAKRFASRESASPPVLTVEYTSSTPELAFTSISKRDGMARLEWRGGAAPWQLQMKQSLPGSLWTDVGPPSTTPAAELPLSAANAFFRVASGLE